MRTLIRLEELGIFVLSVYLYTLLPYRWWVFPLLFFAPDITIAAYVAGPRIGALVYNVVHHRGLSVLIFLAGLFLHQLDLALAGLIMFSHSSLDRAFGFGLKLQDGFTSSHLGKIGRNPEPVD